MKNKTIVVDFKKKEVVKEYESVELSPELVEEIQHQNQEYDFSDFNPIIPGSNFSKFSPQERWEYSEHVLAHIEDASFEDLVFWANNGVLDLKKTNDALGLYEEDFSDDENQNPVA